MTAEVSTRHGRVLAVRGSVIDARFSELPELYHQLRAGDEGRVILEVVAQLNEDTVRALALTPTQGVSRGSEIIDTGRPFTVPVSEELLGRVFNVFGETIDKGSQFDGTPRQSIHQPPLSLTRQATKAEVFTRGTGLTVRNCNYLSSRPLPQPPLPSPFPPPTSPPGRPHASPYQAATPRTTSSSARW